MGEFFSEKCANHGAEIYRKVADAISSHNGITDEGIANYSGIPSIDLVRMILRDLIWSRMVFSKIRHIAEKESHVRVYFSLRNESREI